MDWVAVGVGMIGTMLIFALKHNDDEIEDDYEEDESGITINGKGRYVVMSCQTCRKLKRHQEIEHDLYSCVRCKRQTDLRRKSG
ncbi:hypothetical protein [Bacillus sp. JJ1474]|uniref:hypothetical protein n=1 Tax=Bacillus sp. JJ1474 TaxID=3122955 RepID=UPI002FFE706D